MQFRRRDNVRVKISHNVDVLQCTEEGDFTSSGPTADQFFRELLFEANVVVSFPSHKEDPVIAQSLFGAIEVSKWRIEFCQGCMGDGWRRDHFFGKFSGREIEFLAIPNAQGGRVNDFVQNQD